MITIVLRKTRTDILFASIKTSDFQQLDYLRENSSGLANPFFYTVMLCNILYVLIISITT